MTRDDVIIYRTEKFKKLSFSECISLGFTVQSLGVLIDGKLAEEYGVIEDGIFYKINSGINVDAENNKNLLESIKSLIINMDSREYDLKLIEWLEERQDAVEYRNNT